MIHGSLFSGIGGFDLAAQWMKWQNRFQVEIDPFCRKVLDHHFPQTEKFTDIKNLKGDKFYGAVNIVSAGFPCQPFSVAGKRAGKGDDRYLWPEALRVITKIRPNWIVLENVTGLLSIMDPIGAGNLEIAKTGVLFDHQLEKNSTEIQKRIIATILEQLQQAGYVLPQLTDGTPVIMCIPACSQGAPHRRDRIWIVAHSDDNGSTTPKIRQSNHQGNDSGKAGKESVIQPQRHDRTSEISSAAHTGGHTEPAQTRNRTDQADGQAGQQVWRKSGTIDDGTAAPYPHSNVRSQGRMHATRPETTERLAGPFHPRNSWNPWENFPTQSPVCGGDDGLSFGLADISFSKWRKESIRSLGNAIVPQVAFQIFQSIQQAEYDLGEGKNK
ncbi:DNA (cytosine-5-)-methyltransferase [Chitinophaga sedimenti]|uniref:DNA cytosine methyltransferase n=1 Tax=Chitinophaga sedimenti TaxID=2033606 RepID=UPI002005E8F8|nr:DNA (cytosine-5-)-methyltransferase [Chitinophaga sedimenti]MCK7559470.1 DNA (cytosine-5-)-methyltransferase [Chitinophaga sedimenti]